LEEKLKMNKKILTTLLALLLIASLLLGACAKATTPAPTEEMAAEEPVAEEPAAEEPAVEEPAMPEDMYADVDPTGQTVIFWHNHTQEREVGLNEIIDEFNQTNEWGITVQAEYAGSYNDIFNKMLVTLNSPDAPNVVVAYQNQAATYQLGEGLVDMNPLVNSPKWGLSAEDQADFFPGFWAQDVFPTFGNVRLGIPPNRSMEMLYYNADWLAEMGYDGPPTTPEEFKEMSCKAAQQPFSKATAEGSIGYEASLDASNVARLAFAFGGDIFDYNTSKFTYDSEAAVNAMTLIQEMFNEGCAAYVTERYGDQTDFGAGKTLFTISSSSGLPFYQLAVDAGSQHNWGVAAIPHTTTDPVQNVYGASVSIPNTTPEKNLAAWLFLKFYTSPDVQAKWAEISQYFPVRASVAERLTDYFAANPTYQTAFDLLPYGRFEPPVPGYDFVREKVAEAAAAITGGADVASTLQALNEEANVILSEQMTSPLPTPVPTNTPEPTPEPIGTVDHPIKVLFVPSVETSEIVAGGELLAAKLKEITGLEFVVSVPTSYAATVEEMCASPGDTMGFIPGLGYVLANQLCGVQVAAKAVRFGLDWYAAMVFVARDSEIQTLADLNGLKWAYPDAGSTSGYLYPLYMFQQEGVEAGETIAAGSHDGAIRAVYQGDVDFGTAFYSPPRIDGASLATWEPGDPLTDVPEDLIPNCEVNESTLICGNYEPRDARRNIRAEAPDVIEKLRILAVTPKIPNDTISFSPEFPADVQQAILDALFQFATEDPEGFAEALLAYSWTGINPALDEEYDPIRLGVEAAGFTLEDLGE
jgi:multiple sugar transport system substrate-binding protein